MVKGLILAGGYGTRIRPCSYYLNKHMWPLYNRPLIEYAVEKLIWADITDIGIVLGGSHPKQVEEYLGNGARYGATFTYIWQGAPRGIANGVNCAISFCGNDKFVVHLADNVLEDDLDFLVKEFEDPQYEAMVLLKEVKDPQRFGVADMKNGRLISLEEKPVEPKSNLALVGVYGFNPLFFKLYWDLKPSWRAELELTDVVNGYLAKRKQIYVRVLEGAWFDCGTFDSLLEAAHYEQERVKRRERR